MVNLLCLIVTAGPDGALIDVAKWRAQFGYQWQPVYWRVFGPPSMSPSLIIFPAGSSRTRLILNVFRGEAGALEPVLGCQTKIKGTVRNSWYLKLSLTKPKTVGKGTLERFLAGRGYYLSVPVPKASLATVRYKTIYASYQFDEWNSRLLYGAIKESGQATKMDSLDLSKADVSLFPNLKIPYPISPDEKAVEKKTRH